MKKVPITREGYEALQRELDRFVNEERPANVKAIAEARSHGDLAENAEYHAAKERQSYIEARIAELQVKLGECDILEVQGPHERAVFGATVTLTEINTGQTRTYTLVGPYESAPEKGRLSLASPLGQALLGKEEGEAITLKTPGGVQELEIVEIA